MAQPESIEEATEQNAKGPKRVQVANQSVEQQSIDELIKADQYLAAKQAVSRAGWIVAARGSRVIRNLEERSW